MCVDRAQLLYEPTTWPASHLSIRPPIDCHEIHTLLCKRSPLPMLLASFAVPLPEARVRDILLLCALASVRLLHPYPPTPITQRTIVLIHVGCSLDRPCFPSCPHRVALVARHAPYWPAP